MIECEPSSTFAFDFEFSRAAGFSEASDNPPFLQVAFQYSIIETQEPGKSTEGKADKSTEGAAENGTQGVAETTLAKQR